MINYLQKNTNNDILRVLLGGKMLTFQLADQQNQQNTSMVKRPV